MRAGTSGGGWIVTSGQERKNCGMSQNTDRGGWLRDGHGPPAHSSAAESRLPQGREEERRRGEVNGCSAKQRR
jgi:hypothetical protein